MSNEEIDPLAKMSDALPPKKMSAAGGPGAVDFDQEFERSLTDLADTFQNGVTLKDRTYLLKTYKQCFIGKEAVDFLLKCGAATNRESAVVLGQSLMSDYFLFEHVTRDHPFADDQFYYRFIPENKRGTLGVDSKTGKKVTWSNFLAPTTGEYMAKTNESFQPKLPLPDFEKVPPNDAHVASKVWPLDEHNTTLLNHVHPAAWQDPEANQRDGNSHYDLVVIGGGTAGLITAAGSAGVGAKVAMIEEHMIGGDWYVHTLPT